MSLFYLYLSKIIFKNKTTIKVFLIIQKQTEFINSRFAQEILKDNTPLCLLLSHKE
jgi:hypothetical protein